MENKSNKFYEMVLFLSTIAFQSMGVLENPITKKAETHLDVAQQMIDYLDMLKEKTYNNLDGKELDALNQTIYELKVDFLRVQNEQKEKGEVKKNESKEKEMNKKKKGTKSRNKGKKEE
ncbi:MAG: DUF1844 domain-containing protein [Proteobacteria bacterium]|nr:DUF1844 domain-containing protein [Pseudomonadota bacterium]